MSKVEAIDYGDRQVYTVSAFNRGIGSWLQRLPTVWVEGEICELRRQDRWQSVFFALKDTTDGSILAGLMPRGQFDALRLDLQNGERVHVYGRPELFEPRGELRLRALGIERFGLGEHLAALERLKQELAAEGLFAPERKRLLPRIPRRIGLVTGNDAAAKRDVIASVQARFPPARLVVAETFVQGPRAAAAVVDALQVICAEPEVDVVVLARGGGSFEDLLPFSDERVVRAVAGCPVPVVSAVGHEQDTPLCDLAADVRASTPTAAARLVVPDLEELLASLERARAGLGRGARRSVERQRERLFASATRLEQAAGLLVERRRAGLDRSAAKLRALSPLATLERGYAIVRSEDAVVRSAAGLAAGDEIDVKLAEGAFTATVREVKEMTAHGELPGRSSGEGRP
jgi:exodeoxyribonuclease VII large subunit